MSVKRIATTTGVVLLAVVFVMGAKGKKMPPGLETLSIGAKAPDFGLIGTDEKTYTYDGVSGENGTLIIWTCNHCPYAIAYEDRIIQLTADYTKKGIGVAAISCNDVNAFPNDSFEAMQKRAKDKEFNFPYLFDESQEVALQYGPLVTPHVFLFDTFNTLVYVGRIDNSAKEKEVEDRDLTNAMDALLAGKDVPVTVTKAFGCSIKWKPEHLKESETEKEES